MSPELERRAREAFAQWFGAPPEGIVFAPGRVNLIGEHVDYNDGLVMPMPIPMGTAVAWGRSGGPDVEVVAADLDESDTFPANLPSRPEAVSWRSYLRGMISQWGDPIPGLQLLITGDLPRGSGLSSSASLCIAIGKALCAATARECDPITLSKMAQRTEHDFADVACGIMDQLAVAAGKPGHAMLLDCRDLSFEHHAIPADWAVLIVASGVTRGLVDGEYNARRQQCEAACQMLGRSSLRDVDQATFEAARIGEPESARARHVISEIARVRDAAEALSRSDIEQFGGILRAGHRSLRDDFEVSVPAVDRLVDLLNATIGPKGGARMTGAGFGGSIVVICETRTAPKILDDPAFAAVRVA